MISTSLSSTTTAAHKAQRTWTSNRLLLALAGGILLSVIAGCAGGTNTKPTKSGEDLRVEARAAFVAQDYPRTLAIAESQAFAGVPWAQYTLGYMYYYGRGVTLDRTRARDWIERAANQNYPQAKEALKRVRAPEPAGTDVFPESSPKPASAQPPAAVSAPLSPPPTSSLAKPEGAAITTNTPTAPTAPTDAQSPSATMEETPPPPSAALPPSATASPVTEQGGLTKTFVLPQNTGPAPAAPSANSEDIRSNVWIASQDPRRLTLQLVGSSDKNAVLRYMQEHGITRDAAYYSTIRDGQLWYVVIYGNFADRNAAQTALLALPPSLGAASPWIRQFGDIRPHLSGTQ